MSPSGPDSSRVPSHGGASALGKGRALRAASRAWTASDPIPAPRLVFLNAVGGLLRATSWWERAASRWSSVTLYVSNDERQAGERVGVRSRWAVIPNGVDADYWHPPSLSDRANARAQLGIPAHAHLVLCVARLQRAKGVDVLVSAWPHILRDHPNAQLVIVGDGPDRTQLSACALRQVAFAGTRDPMPFLAAADVFVAPSRWEAGASLAVLEAMACGLPVVATNVNGMRCFLEEQSLAPVESAGALATMISALLHSEVERQRRGRKNRETINMHGSLARSTARTAALTLHTCGESRQRTHRSEARAPGISISPALRCRRCPIHGLVWTQLSAARWGSRRRSRRSRRCAARSRQGGCGRRSPR